MGGPLIILGIIIAVVAVFVAFDNATLIRKAIGCIIGGAVLGMLFLTPFGAAAGIIAPSSNPVLEDMLFASLFCGVIGLIIGTFSGSVALGLSVLIRYIFSEQIEQIKLKNRYQEHLLDYKDQN